MFQNMTKMESPDYTGLMLVEVINNNDPLKLQRVQIRPKLGNIITPEKDTDLPWCALIHGSMGPGISATSSIVCVPEVVSLLVVEFQEGNLLYGVVRGHMPTDDHPTDSRLLTNYPNRRGTIDKAGTIMYIDSQSPEIYLKQGNTEISIKSGVINITTGSGTIGLTADTVTVTGKLHVTGAVTMDDDLSVTKNTTLTGTLGVTGATTMTSMSASSGKVGTGNAAIDITNHVHLYTDNPGSAIRTTDKMKAGPTPAPAPA